MYINNSFSFVPRYQRKTSDNRSPEYPLPKPAQYHFHQAGYRFNVLFGSWLSSDELLDKLIVIGSCPSRPSDKFIERIRRIVAKLDEDTLKTLDNNKIEIFVSPFAPFQLKGYVNHPKLGLRVGRIEVPELVYEDLDRKEPLYHQNNLDFERELPALIKTVIENVTNFWTEQQLRERVNK